MSSFKQFLLESQEINLSMKAYKLLSYASRSAIDSWETMNWDEGDLTKAIKSNNAIAKEIKEVFSPVREYLKKRYGSKIRLYRGLQEQGVNYSKDKVLESWSSDKKVAEYFAGLRFSQSGNSSLYKTHSDDDVNKAIATFKRKGFVSFRNVKYIINKEQPEYTNMYNKSNSFMTDMYTKDFEKNIRDDIKTISDMNKDMLSKSTVIEENISIDRIIWITNNLNSKEFIVRK